MQKKLLLVPLIFMIQCPVFDSVLMEKVLYPALGADCRTYNKFTIARYAICQVTVILFEKETRPPLRYGRFFINH